MTTSLNSAELRRMDLTLLEAVDASTAALKHQIVQQLLRPEVGLRAPAQADHDRPGWLSAQDSHTLAAAGFTVPGLELAFPVPAACAWWHGAERAADGPVFRFFARQAWLHTVAESGQNRLSVTVHHGLHANSWRLLRLTSPDVDLRMLPPTTDARGRPVVQAVRTDPHAQNICLHLHCSDVGQVNQVHPASLDGRYLSLAVGRPVWSSGSSPVAQET